MKQYCRYCAFCFEADEFRCSDHERYMTREQINRLNHCPNFTLSELGDVETGKQYMPRKRKIMQGNQQSLLTYLDINGNI